MKKFFLIVFLGLFGLLGYSQVKPVTPVSISSVTTGLKFNIDSVYKQVQILGITNKVKVDSSYTRYKTYMNNFVAPDTTKTRYKVYMNNFVAPDTTKTRRAVVIDSVYKSVQIHGITDAIVVDSTKTRGYMKINNYVDIDSTTTRKEILELSPLSIKYLSQTIVDSVNTGVAGTITVYYPSSTTGYNQNGYKDFSVMFSLLGGVTISVWATIDIAGSPLWIDITKSGYELKTNSAGSATYSDSDGILDFSNLNVKSVQIRTITTDATNTKRIMIRQKAL